MLTLTKILPDSTDNINVDFTLYLMAEQRNKTRQRLEIEGEIVFLDLPRGKVLKEGDLLQSANEAITVRVAAKPEPVITATAKNELDLLKAAYHLGNRHVALEIASSYLRLAPDSVLQAMLVGLGLEVKEEIVPFFPETGAYKDHH